jgi:hypothetical protein
MRIDTEELQLYLAKHIEAEKLLIKSLAECTIDSDKRMIVEAEGRLVAWEAIHKYIAIATTPREKAPIYTMGSREPVQLSLWKDSK